VNNASQLDRLRDQIRALREQAGQLPAGEARDDLLRKAKQEEIALRLIEWVTFPEQVPPPEDVVSIKKHRLRRE
jgi:hypothetical protein